MAYFRTTSYDDGRIMRAAVPGDVVSLAEIPTPLVTVGAGVITAAAIAGQVVLRTLAGSAVSDTTDTAVNLMQALYGNTGGGPRVGEGFLCFYSNQTGFIMTIAGGVGVTVSGTPAVAVASSKQLLFVCTTTGVQTFANGVFTNVGATFNCICL